MTNFSEKVIRQLQALRFRDYLMGVGIMLVIIPTWLTYRVIEDTQKLAALIELKTGYRVINTMLGCQHIGATHRSRASYQIVKEGQTSTAYLRIGQYAEKSTMFSDDEARKICIYLTQNEKRLINDITDNYQN